MPFIHLTTFIAAPQERVFDLSRSLDLHRHSMKSYGESIVGGSTAGLLGEGEEVVWKARHLWKERVMRVRITQMKRPDYFVDEQVEGDFALMKHEHYFKPVQNGTIMIDQFRFEAPYGLAGKLVNALYLEKYMTRLITERNAVIKSVSEGGQWTQFIHQ